MSTICSRKAVLVVTSHWESDGFTVSSGAAPGMIYDYGGFPPHTYDISYPAPGAPQLHPEAPGNTVYDWALGDEAANLRCRSWLP